MSGKGLAAYLADGAELGVTAIELEAGGPRLWAKLMADLRTTHLGHGRRLLPSPASNDGPIGKARP